MKQLLVTTAAVLVATPVFAAPSQEIAAKCKDARDFQGCVKAFTSAAPAEEDALTPLRNAMRQVAARLSSGTSLRDSSAVFQPVIDAHAVAPESEHEAKAYKDAKLAIALFDMTRQAWQTRIESTRHYGSQPYMPGKACDYFAEQIKRFNAVAGSNLSFTYQKKGLLGVCHRTSARPETLMYNHTIKVLRDGSVDPKVIAAKEAKAARERELCALGPWNRYLEENPGMKKWAEANPAAAEDAQKKFLAKPENQKECGSAAANSIWNPASLDYSNYR